MKKTKKKVVAKKKVSKKEPKQLHSLRPTAYICIRPGTNTLTHPHGFLEYPKAVQQCARSSGVVSSLQFVEKNFGPVELKPCTCCKDDRDDKKK